MLQEITIKNFKSIADDTIQLGRVNVFIGENGCGKSNILEAVGFASIAETYEVIDANILYMNGIRVTKPSLMLNLFEGTKPKEHIDIKLKFDDIEKDCIISPLDKDDIHSKWGKHLKWNKNDIDNTLTLIKEMEANPSKADEITKQLGHQVALKFAFKKSKSYELLSNYKIYILSTESLRGIGATLRNELFGGNLDTIIAEMDEAEIKKLKSYTYFIDWFDDFFIDVHDELKYEGHKLNYSKSLLYFKDKFMLKNKKNNIFSAENANEGILHVLFYLAVLISKRTPKFFAIDNIESCLNPHLCRHLMKEICTLAEENDKQLLITTHNPAILDGLDLRNDNIRLFEVRRLDNGHTNTRRINIKPEIQNEMGGKYKLSELWTRGYLGAISQNF